MSDTTCLFLAPADLEGRDALVDAVQGALAVHGVRMMSLQELETHSWRYDLARSIERVDLVLADLTGSSPNVAYELGIAHALGKPTLLVTQSQEVPSDISAYQFITYRPGDVEKLADYIGYWVLNVLTEVSAP